MTHRLYYFKKSNYAYIRRDKNLNVAKDEVYKRYKG